MDCLLQNKVLEIESLPNLCPKQARMNEPPIYIGCFKFNKKIENNTHIITSIDFPDHNSTARCVKWCQNVAAPFAGLVNRTRCFCSSEFQSVEATASLNDSRWCQFGCPGSFQRDAEGDEGQGIPEQHCGSFNAIAVYDTGAIIIESKRPHGFANYMYGHILLNKPVRIVYLLVLNGRSWRSLKRQLRMIYHSKHYYYIHVSANMNYLHAKALTLAQTFPNVRITPWRLRVVWAGVTLLDVLLRAMDDLLKMTDWKWDFFVNLSETDLPLKSTADLTAFLTFHKDKNFIGFSMKNNAEHMKFSSDFYIECDDVIWKLGAREYPSNIAAVLGSDWFTFNRRFINYVVNSDDALVTGLKAFTRNIFCPTEAFFHIVGLNSVFCDKILNSNLHLINWNRDIGCTCDRGKSQRLCGCSPNVIHYSKDRENVINSPDFFARKFDATIDLGVINMVETLLHNLNMTKLVSTDAHWENIYSPRWDTEPSWDIYRTGLESLSRHARHLALEKHTAPKCRSQNWELVDVFAYFRRNVFRGLLIRSRVGSVAAGVVVETLMKLKSNRTANFKRFSPDQYDDFITFGVRNRLIDFSIGVKCDQRESRFRDQTHFIGPTSRISIATWFKHGFPLFNLAFVFIAPNRRNYFQFESKFMKRGHRMECFNPKLPSPRSLGMWKVLLVINYQNRFWTLAENSFMVIPQAYHRGSIIVDSDTAASVNSHVNPEDDEFIDEDPSRWIGSQLTDYVDKVVGTIWKPLDHCVTHYSNYLCFDFNACSSTQWSSDFPDPKSHLGSVSPLTGRIEMT